MQSNIPDPRIHSSLGASPPGSSADGSAQQPKPCAEQDLRTILNSLREAIFTIDGQDRIWMFNPAASRVFGIPEEELFGLPVARLHVDEEAALRFKANHMATLHRDGTAEDEIPMRRGDGEIFAAETTLVLLGDLSGVKNGYILVVRDINHRKRNQEQVMRRTRQMAVLNEIGSLLNRSLERDDVLPLTLEKLRQRLQCERVNFFAVKGSREPGEMILFQGAPGNTATAAAATLPETPSRTGPVWRAAST
ncbi:MAG: PAS domain S-box protein, partial [Acidobacteriota bacterium]